MTTAPHAFPGAPPARLTDPTGRGTDNPALLRLGAVALEALDVEGELLQCVADRPLVLPS